MMRIKGLGGHKLYVLWQKAKIDDIERLLETAKTGKISKLPGLAKDRSKYYRSDRVDEHQR